MIRGQLASSAQARERRRREELHQHSPCRTVWVQALFPLPPLGSLLAPTPVVYLSMPVPVSRSSTSSKSSKSRWNGRSHVT